MGEGLESANTKPRVLVVDDDAALQMLARAALEQEGFEVEEALDGAAGLEAFAQRRPDIVLMDVNMPKADGFTVCGKIRQRPEGAYTPVMMMTGADDVDAIHTAYEVGATDFITKPLNWVLLGYRLRYVLRAARTRENLQARTEEVESFAWALSHDLKTPLVSLQGMAGLLVDECGSELGESAQRYLGRITTTVGEMGALLSNVLALSRIGREDGTPGIVSLDEVADLAIERQAELVRARSIKVTRGALGEVRGLRMQVEQVLVNLVGNAVKYLGPQTEPQVEIGRAERDGTVEYFVRDNGIGMAAAYHAKVFEPFQRLKDVDAEGSGVGLTIVKKIVESVGGHVGVESAPGAGSTFFFTWPR